jgi:hypothetical protein
MPLRDGGALGPQTGNNIWHVPTYGHSPALPLSRVAQLIGEQIGSKKMA